MTDDDVEVWLGKVLWSNGARLFGVAPAPG